MSGRAGRRARAGAGACHVGEAGLRPFAKPASWCSRSGPGGGRTCCSSRLIYGSGCCFAACRRRGGHGPRRGNRVHANFAPDFSPRVSLPGGAFARFRSGRRTRPRHTLRPPRPGPPEPPETLETLRSLEDWARRVSPVRLMFFGERACAPLRWVWARVAYDAACCHSVAVLNCAARGRASTLARSRLDSSPPASSHAQLSVSDIRRSAPCAEGKALGVPASVPDRTVAERARWRAGVLACWRQHVWCVSMPASCVEREREPWRAEPDPGPEGTCSFR